MTTYREAGNRPAALSAADRWLLKRAESRARKRLHLPPDRRLLHRLASVIRELLFARRAAQ